MFNRNWYKGIDTAKNNTPNTGCKRIKVQMPNNTSDQHHAQNPTKNKIVEEPNN